jgi:hypothetical protein
MDFGIEPEAFDQAQEEIKKKDKKDEGDEGKKGEKGEEKEKEDKDKNEDKNLENTRLYVMNLSY